MLERDWLPRALWGAIAICLIGGLVAVPVVGDGSRGSDVRTARGEGGWVGTVGSTVTTTAPACLEDGACDGGDPAAASREVAPAADQPAAGATAPTPTTTAGPAAASGGGATAAPSTAPPTTAAPLPDGGTPADPGPTVPPRAGRYRYKVSGPEGETETTSKYEDKATTPTERRQLLTMTLQGAQAEVDLAWRADGAHVLSMVVTLGTNRMTCDWDPDTLQLRLPLSPGTTWDSSSTCKVMFGASEIVINRRVTGRVVELRRVVVAGQPVDVWAIEGTEHLDIGGRSGDRTGTVLFSPKHGLAVSSFGKATSSDGKSGDYREDLLNLDPE